MHKASRFYVANAGFKLAWYDGQLLPFTDLGTDAPTHTILNLVNQGGKTTLLALLLSIFDPDRKRFLQTISTPAHRFDDYFDRQGLPGLIAVEWQTPGDLLARVRLLVTGQIVCMKKSGDVHEPERWFFYFYANGDLRLDALPAPNLEGGRSRQLKSHTDVLRWLQEMREKHAGSFDYTQNQGAWRDMMESLGLDVEMIRQQVDFNKREGAMDEAFLDFKTEHDFVRRFLNLAFDTGKADNVRELVATHCRRMARRKPLQESLGQLNRLAGVFDPFAEAASAYTTARDKLAAAERRIGGARATLTNRAAARRADAKLVSELATVQEGIARQAGAEKLAQTKNSEGYTAEVKRRQRLAAEAARKAADNVLDECKKFARLLSASQLLGEIRAAQAEVKQLDKSIELANQNEVVPLRQELARCGALYACALEEAMREKVSLKRVEEVKLGDFDVKLRTVRAREAELRTEEGAVRKAAGKVENFLEMAHAARRRMVEQDHLAESDDVTSGLKNLEAQLACRMLQLQQAEEAATRAVDGARQALTLTRSLTAEQAVASTQRTSLGNTIEEGRALREKLQSLRILCRAATAELADVDSEVLPSRLTALTEHLRQQHNTARIELARLEDARKSIELTRLAGQDPDVTKVVRALVDAGVKNVRSHAIYVAEVVQDEALARELVTSDPARFLGVAVNTAAQLTEAQRALAVELHLGRPVQVSVATDKTQPPDPTAFTVHGDNAHYHYAAAQRRLQSLAPDEERAIRQASALQTQLDEARDAKLVLDQYRERFGDGKLARMRGELESADANLQELIRRIREAEADTERCNKEEQDARNAAAQIRTSIAGLEKAAGQLRTYVEQYERHLPDRKQELEQHAKSLERLKLAIEDLDGTKNDLAVQRQRVVDLISSFDADHKLLAARRVTVAHVDTDYDAVGALRRTPQSLEVLAATYAGALQALRAVEEQKTGPLVATRNARSDELSRSQTRWGKEFKDIAEAEADALVGVDYDRDGAIADENVRTAEKTRTDAVAKEGAAKAAVAEFQEKRTYPGHSVAGVESLVDAGLAFALENARDLAGRAAGQEETANGEKEKATKDSERLTAEARQLDGCAKQMAGLLPEYAELGTGDESLFPAGAEVNEVCAALSTDLTKARAAVDNTRANANRLHEKVKAIAAEEAFAKTDLDIAIALRGNTLETAMDDHERISKALTDRKAAVESELATMHADFERAADALLELVTIALRLLRRATEALLLPESAPIVGGLPVLRMPKTVLHLNQEQRKERLRPFLEELVADGNIPETGAALTTSAVMRLAHGHLGLQILKIVADKDEQYIPVDHLSHSGAEKIAMALFLYFVIARLRYEQRANLKKAEGGVLFLDNPFAKATARPIWQAIVGLADSMGVQLIITTGVKEYEALSVFKRFIRLAPGQESKTNGRKHIRVVDYQFRPEAEHRELTA